MSDLREGSDQVGDQSRFAARAFIARFVRETGQQPTAEFAYEIGYLRGRSDATLEVTKMFDTRSQVHEDARKDSDADTE